MLRIEQHGDDVLIWVKAVPGASRDEIAGVVGDRLKVRVSTPAERGKANAAICVVLARALGVRPCHVTIDSGLTNPQKTVRVAACEVRAVAKRFA